MTQFISSLFGSSSAEKEAERSRQMAEIAQQRQAQQLQEQKAETARQLAGAGKSVRGQRLLMSSESGGLADKLGAA